MTEEFRQITLISGVLEISNHGNLRRLLKNGNYRNIKGSISNKGYKYYQCNINGKRYNYQFHRLVGQAFLTNSNNYPVIDHIDRNKLNNNVSNLRYCSYRNNSRNTDRFIPNIPGDTPKERKRNYDKIYSEKNKDKIKQRNKNYYELNKDKIIKRNAEYQKLNKDKDKKHKKTYRNKHKEELKIKASKKIKCECGSEFRHDWKAKHLKTKKHINYITNKTDDN